MVESIGQNNNFMPPRMDPDKYAQQYASQKGISLEEAKIQLKTQYGDPQQRANNANSIFGENAMQNYDSASLSSSLNSEEMASQLVDLNRVSLQKIFQSLLDMLKGGDGPRQEGDPQHHLQGTQDTASTGGPQKEGDPQPHLQNSQSSLSLQAAIDPDEYAQQYASEKGITLEEAKAELKTKYGEPGNPFNN